MRVSPHLLPHAIRSFCIADELGSLMVEHLGGRHLSSSQAGWGWAGFAALPRSCRSKSNDWWRGPMDDNDSIKEVYLAILTTP